MEKAFLKNFRQVRCKASAMETFFIKLQKGLEIYLKKTPTQVLSKELYNIFWKNFFEVKLWIPCSYINQKIDSTKK